MASAWRAGLLKGVHELRFAFCQTSEASEGVRCVQRCLRRSESKTEPRDGRPGRSQPDQPYGIPSTTGG